jgi:hypothetical protein
MLCRFFGLSGIAQIQFVPDDLPVSGFQTLGLEPREGIVGFGLVAGSQVDFRATSREIFDA